MAEKELIEVPPTCTWCEEFIYKQEAEEKYICKVNCIQTNDIFEMWEECPYLERKYLVWEPHDDEDGEDD